MAVDIDLVLAPVDCSDDAEQAAEYALAIAEKYGADLHLLHILDQRVKQGLDCGDLSPETIADEQRAFTGRVRRQNPNSDTVSISQSSAIGFSQTQLARTPGSVILDAADELAADFLVVPRVTPSGSTDEVLGKAALHVLEYASQPVLSV